MPSRCPWAESSAQMRLYHDREWAVPVHDDRTLFEFLVLESAQAGLSWETILQRRQAYRLAYCGFDPVRVAAFGTGEIAQCLRNPGIVRNRAKIEASVNNAARLVELQRSYGSFDAYLWRFVAGRPLRERYRSQAEVPAQSEHSRRLSRDLKQHGFRFVGPTICQAYMQAVGLLDHHLVSCFRA